MPGQALNILPQLGHRFKFFENKRVFESADDFFNFFGVSTVILLTTQNLIEHVDEVDNIPMKVLLAGIFPLNSIQ